MWQKRLTKICINNITCLNTSDVFNQRNRFGIISVIYTSIYSIVIPIQLQYVLIVVMVSTDKKNSYCTSLKCYSHVHLFIHTGVRKWRTCHCTEVMLTLTPLFLCNSFNYIYIYTSSLIYTSIVFGSSWAIWTHKAKPTVPLSQRPEPTPTQGHQHTQTYTREQDR